MAQTKFSAGDRVSVARGGGVGGPSGAYRIVGALPVESGRRQYRVRSDGEQFDRIVDESRLEATQHE